MKISIGLLRVLRYASLVALFIGVSGCSSFNRDWKRAQANVPASDLAGAWDGSWVSQRNGHHGQLRAIIDKKGESDYRARFHATFWKIFSYSYAIPLRTVPEKEHVTFDGSADLGWLAGGEYRCQGLATATNFHATYSSKGDHGTFQMNRPPTLAR